MGAGANADTASPFADTQHLTGLRGYAALYVFLIHVGGYGLRGIGRIGDRFVDHGKYGVVCFFVLSAITLTMSIRRTPRFVFRRYLARRVRRIVPLYYVMCAVGLLWPATWYLDFFGVEADLENFLWHVTFLNLFRLPYLHSLLGVEWTIPVEMAFYLVLPWAVLALRKRGGLLIVLLAAGALYLTREPWIDGVTGRAIERPIAEAVSPQRYIICFLVGMLIAPLVERTSRGQQRPALFLVVVALWALHLLVDLGSDVPIYTGLTALGILVSGPRNVLSRVLFTNPIALYLGTISYSIYLVHVPVTSGLRAMLGDVAATWLALPMTLAAASLTYWAIERPFMRARRGAQTPVREARPEHAP